MDSNSNSQNSVPGVPPPPAEVKVRTMRSDLQSMAKSGGGLPQFQNVSVAGLQVEREAPGAVAAPEVAAQMARAIAAPSVSAPAPVGEEVPVSSSGGSSHTVGIILVIVVAVLAIAAVGYFAYKELGSSAASVPAAGTPDGQ